MENKINVPMKIGTAEVKFFGGRNAYINIPKAKINGVFYKISAYPCLHSNGVWELHEEGQMPYTGKPNMYRVDENGNTEWGKDPTPTAYKVARENILEEFRSRVANWKDLRMSAQKGKLVDEIQRLDDEAEEKAKEIREIQGKREAKAKELNFLEVSPSSFI